MKQQIEISLGGKKRKFTFGILFLGELLERKEFEDYNDMLLKVSKNPFKYAPILMYESLKNTCNKYNKEVDFTEKDVLNWLVKEEEVGMDKMLKYLQTFMGSTDNKTPNEVVEENNDDSKKK